MRPLLALPIILALASPGQAQTFPAVNSTIGTLPTLDVDRNAATNGKSWSVATGNVTIASGKVLDVVFANAAGSGCNAVFVLRRYSNYSTSQLAYTTYNNPGALTGATASNVGTRQAGVGPQSGLSFAYVVENSGLMTGTAGVTDGILAAAKDDITIPYNVPPGKSFGLEISGLTGALAGSVTVSVTLVGYCQ